MKPLVLALGLVAAASVAAHADGWGAAEGCHEGDDSDSGGCTCDNDSDPEVECSCATSDPVSIGTSLGIVGIVAWRIGRKRRSR